jgi:beta-glucosidase
VAFEARAAKLVRRMTLDEKASQLKSDSPAIARLGIPAYNWWSEGLHGVARAGEATVFPQAIGIAATFDVPLSRAVADVTSTEFRAKYRATVSPDGSSGLYRGLTVWSPNVNIFRDPRWGRGQETFGEDPYLTSQFGVAYIEGLQGTDPTYYKTLAVVKHFAVHSGPEADRHREDPKPSRYDLEDTYLPAFRAAVTQAHPGGVMCAYNAIDGIPACASPLLEERLRKNWGLAGHVVTDCAAMLDFFEANGHAYSRSPEAAVATALKAGTDLICSSFGPNRSADPAVITSAVRQGLLPEPVLDRAVTRLIVSRMRLGLIARVGDVPYTRIPVTENDTPAHAALNQRVARESLVLLKNTGLLPLKAEPASIAVIGPNANSVDALVGNYAGTPSRPKTLLAGLRGRFPRARIEHVEGVGTVGLPLSEVADDALCVDRACTAHGLKVEEYRNGNLAAPPIRTGVDRNARFAWGRPVRTERDTVIRWSGFIKAGESGPYRFRLESENGYRVLIDGKEVVGAWDATDPASIAEGEIQLTKGQLYALTVEAQQKGSRGEQRLLASNFSQREEAALAAARTADLVVFAAGLNQHVEGEEMRVHADGFAGGDRTSLDLPAVQQHLLEQIHALGKPIVLVLMNGSALGINWADQNIPAIIEAWYPGGEGGRAIADLIAGDYSPAGRLPVTFYKSSEQLPPFKDYAMRGRTYRYFTGTPLYPFGYGLSYSRFVYNDPRVSLSHVHAGAPITISARVTNAGERDSDEVVQLYVSRPIADAPIRALKGFQRVHFARGESRTIIFTLDDDALSVVDEAGRRKITAGRVRLWIGGGQPAPAGEPAVPGVAADIMVQGEKALPN